MRIPAERRPLQTRCFLQTHKTWMVLCSRVTAQIFRRDKKWTSKRKPSGEVQNEETYFKGRIVPLDSWETNWVQAFESDRMTSGSQMWLGMIPWELIHYRKRQIDERFASSTPGKTDTFFNASTSCFHRGTGPSSCFPVPFLGADERLGEE